MPRSGTSASCVYWRCRQSAFGFFSIKNTLFSYFSPLSDSSLNGNKMDFSSFLCTIPGVLYLLFLLPRTWCFAGGFPKLNLSWWVFQLWIWKRIWLQDSPDHWNERIGQYVITVSGELLKKKKTIIQNALGTLELELESCWVFPKIPLFALNSVTWSLAYEKVWKPRALFFASPCPFILCHLAKWMHRKLKSNQPLIKSKAPNSLCCRNPRKQELSTRNQPVLCTLGLWPSVWWVPLL